MKKLVTLFLIAAMLLAMTVPGLAEDAKPYDGVTLRIAVNTTEDDPCDSFDERHWVAQAEKALGIDVEFIEIVGSTSTSEKIALLLAGDLPDVFWMGSSMGDNVVVSNASLFVPLNDLIETKAPNVYNLYETSVPGWREFLTYPDGNIYGLMTGWSKSIEHYTQMIQWTNTEWLNKLGLEMPTDVNGFHDMLVAFRDKDPNGNGIKDEIPLDFCNNNWGAYILNYAYMWGLPISSSVFYNIKDGQVVGAVDTDAFREFLETMYVWGQEGLLNLEGFSQTSEQYIANIAGNLTGSAMMWWPGAFIDGDERLNWSVQMPVSAEGYTASILPNAPNFARRNGYMITTACKNVDAALAFFDYLSADQDMAITVYKGDQGIFWDHTEDGKDWFTYSTYDKQALIDAGYQKLVDGGFSDYVIGRGVYYEDCPLLICQAVANPAEPDSDYAIRLDSMVKYIQPYLAESMSQIIVPAEYTEELDFKTDGLASLINSYVASSILNGITDESWENFKTDLDKYGYQYYLEWYNKELNNQF